MDCVKTWIALVILLLLVGLSPEGGEPAFASSPLPDAPSAAATVIAAGGKLRSGSAPAPLPVQVANVQKLGAATIRVRFDPLMLRATGCQRSSLFDVGMCNPNEDTNGDGKADAVLFNVLSIGGVSAGASPVTVTNIMWQPVLAVAQDTLTNLSVEVLTFADVNSLPLEHATQDGPVVVRPAPPTFKTYLPAVRRP